MNFPISSFITSFLGYTPDVDPSADIKNSTETKTEREEVIADQISKVDPKQEQQKVREASFTGQKIGENLFVEITDGVPETPTDAVDAKPEAAQAEAPPAPIAETLETARAKNEHFIGDNEIDGNSKGLLSTLAELGGVNIGDISKLETGKTLEKQGGKISEEQAKNLTEMLDSIKDPAKSGPYLAKLKANHDQKLAEQLRQRDQRLQQLEDANQAGNQGANPDLIRAIKDENNRFAQKMMNDMARLKLWEERQKWKNSQMAAMLASIHDSIKLAASVQ